MKTSNGGDLRKKEKGERGEEIRRGDFWTVRSGHVDGPDLIEGSQSGVAEKGMRLKRSDAIKRWPLICRSDRRRKVNRRVFETGQDL